MTGHTPSAPDKYLRWRLREYALKHPCNGFTRAHAWCAYDESMAFNRKKVQRLCREKGLTHKKVHRMRRTGASTVNEPVVVGKPNHV